jgi:hypothetical protein
MNWSVSFAAPRTQGTNGCRHRSTRTLRCKSPRKRTVAVAGAKPATRDNLASCPHPSWRMSAAAQTSAAKGFDARLTAVQQASVTLRDS